MNPDIFLYLLSVEQALWLPKHWTMVTGVSIFTFRTIDSFHVMSQPYRNAHLEGKMKLCFTDRQLFFTQIASSNNVVKRRY